MQNGLYRVEFPHPTRFRCRGLSFSKMTISGAATRRATLSTLTRKGVQRDCPPLFPATVSRGQIPHVALQVRGELFGLECADLLYQPGVPR